MKLASRVVAFVLVALVAFWFTAENSRELVNVDLFLFRVRASLPLVVFGSMLVGMVAVFLVGLRADLRVRRLLARYREALERGGGPVPDAGGDAIPVGFGPDRPDVAGAPEGGAAAETGDAFGIGEPPEDAGSAGGPIDEEEPDRKEGRSDDRRASTPST